jgi:tagatose 6-phosphate kinase
MPKVYNYKGEYTLVVCPNPSVDIYAWTNGIHPSESNRLQKEEHYAGGKGVHVALALAELGKNVVLLGFWGGPTGEWIKQQCEEYLSLKCVGPSVHGWSRSCYTFKSETDFDDTELLGVGPYLNEENVFAFYSLFDELVKNANGVVLSGSWPKGSPDNGYARLVQSATKNNKATILDCTGVQFENAIKEFPTLVHLNRSEATHIFGIGNVIAASGKLINYCDYAAITDGARGLYLTNNGRTIHGSCSIENVYSSVGSGDCLTAGLTIGLIEKLGLESMAKFGVACGAANCLRKELGYLHKTDVQSLLKQADAKELQTTT